MLAFRQQLGGVGRALRTRERTGLAFSEKPSLFRAEGVDGPAFLFEEGITALRGRSLPSNLSSVRLLFAAR